MNPVQKYMLEGRLIPGSPDSDSLADDRRHGRARGAESPPLHTYLASYLVVTWLPGSATVTLTSERSGNIDGKIAKDVSAPARNRKHQQ